MMGIKSACKNLVVALNFYAEKCDQFVRGLVPKHDCARHGQDVIKATKNMIMLCRDHLKECKNVACSEVCKACIKACEKVVEKTTACIDACMGSGTDQDAKEVCKECAKACRDCVKVCNDCFAKACS